MKLKQKDWMMVSKLLMGSALVAVIFSAIGYAGSDIWLASTQWLLIAAVLAAFGLYTRMNDK